MAWQKAVGISTRGLELWICEECLCQFCMSSEKMVSIIHGKLYLTEEKTTSSSDGIAPRGMLSNWSYRLSTAGGTCWAEAMRASISLCFTAGIHVSRYAISVAASDLVLFQSIGFFLLWGCTFT